MKYITFLVLLMAYSCGNTPTMSPIGSTSDFKSSTSFVIDDNEISDTRLYVVTLDSCEYLYQPYGYSALLAHKGNCKYCQQRLTNQLFILQTKK